MYTLSKTISSSTLSTSYCLWVACSSTAHRKWSVVDNYWRGLHCFDSWLVSWQVVTWDCCPLTELSPDETNNIKRNIEHHIFRSRVSLLDMVFLSNTVPPQVLRWGKTIRSTFWRNIIRPDPWTKALGRRRFLTRVLVRGVQKYPKLKTRIENPVP